MSGSAKGELIIALQKSVLQLQQGIDTHRCLIASILDNEAGVQNLEPLSAMCPERSREAQMKAAIQEAIDVLEESRKAFKSKRLEILRKKLTQVLISTE